LRAGHPSSVTRQELSPISDIQARNNLTSDQYQQTFDELTAAGFQLTWVNGCEVGGQPLFAAIFEQ
jgi:hypothetical protein